MRKRLYSGPAEQLNRSGIHVKKQFREALAPLVEKLSKRYESHDIERVGSMQIEFMLMMKRLVRVRPVKRKKR